MQRLKRKQQEIENREQRQEMISSHGVKVKAEPEEYGDDIGEHFGGVFGYGDELHIASAEDKGQSGVEMEMDNEGIWKGFVLSKEMCEFGEHLI